MKKEEFGDDFHWGVSSSAFQTEGAWRADGKGPSIWDEFTLNKKKIYKNQDARIACNFYHHYEWDLNLLRQLNVNQFRHSIAWSRILPEGKGKVNQKGLDFYDRMVDRCLDFGINPWLTLYHWDLPQALEDKGGWTNRDIVAWFCEYANICIDRLGDRVKHWMVLNEPLAFSGLGYFLGIHAPGKTGFSNFLPALHHASLAQAEVGRFIKSSRSDVEVGTTFSISPIHPLREKEKDLKASERVDFLFNRLYLEPLFGKGYPADALPFLEKMSRYLQPGDERLLSFEYDFVGLQNYTREVVRFSPFAPYLKASLVKARKRSVPVTAMGWEVYKDALYEAIKIIHTYSLSKKIIISENGIALEDRLVDGKVNDIARIDFLKNSLKQIRRAQEEGIKVKGYFLWTFTDNFEWAEGYRPRFGIVYTNFRSQERFIKESGFWFKNFLQNGNGTIGRKEKGAHLEG